MTLASRQGSGTHSGQRREAAHHMAPTAARAVVAGPCATGSWGSSAPGDAQRHRTGRQQLGALTEALPP